MSLSHCHLGNNRLTRQGLQEKAVHKCLRYVVSCRQQSARDHRPVKFLSPKASAPTRTKLGNGKQYCLVPQASHSRPQIINSNAVVITGAAATDYVQELAGHAQGSKESFAWGKHWYPLMLEADLDPSAPSAHTLLNINMVIWQDGQSKWGASEDKCPHRYRARFDSWMATAIRCCGLLLPCVKDTLVPAAK